jgi:phosphate transport system protein
VARDLRYVTGILKIDSDLERMADLAVNIAERGRDPGRGAAAALPAGRHAHGGAGKRMVRDGLDSLQRLDAPLALRTWQADAEADRCTAS